MTVRSIQPLALLLVSVLYWQLVCHVSGAKEPWDAYEYWRIWYPVSLALAALAGFAFGRRGWLAGTIITFAQLPVMWANTGIGALLVVGAIFLCALAVPAVAVSTLAGRLGIPAFSDDDGKGGDGAV